jgi:hypothetical protein
MSDNAAIDPFGTSLQQEISVDDRGVETGDCDLRQRPGMGQGAAAVGRVYDRAGEIACRRTKSSRLRDERNQEQEINAFNARCSRHPRRTLAL